MVALVGKASKKLVKKLVPLTVNPAVKACKAFVKTLTAMLQEAPATREATPAAIPPSDPALADTATSATNTANTANAAYGRTEKLQPADTKRRIRWEWLPAGGTTKRGSTHIP